MIEVAAVGLGSAALVYGYNRLTGCTGGHVWGDWEDVDRWRVDPYGNGDRVCVERKQERHCEAAGCYEHDERYEMVRENIYSISFENAIEDTTEVHYECPLCFEVFPDSERETDWRTHSYGKRRYEKCPNCHYKSEPSEWTRVGWEQ